MYGTQNMTKRTYRIVRTPVGYITFHNSDISDIGVANCQTPTLDYLYKQSTKGTTMTTLLIPISILEDEDIMVCVFCDQDTTLPYCASCNEYKGLMSIIDWEAYTGETWES